MKENKAISFFKSPRFSIIASILTFTIAFFIGYLQDKVGDTNLLIGAVFTVTISLLSVGIYSLYGNQKLEENFISKISILEDFIRANGLGNIINSKTLAIWESSASSIWVVTNDLSNDIGISSDHNIGNDIFNAVHKNLAEGKKYTYFIPNTKEIKGAINTYKEKHFGAYKEDQVFFCFIKAEEGFHFINELALYDVTESVKTKAVQRFPNKELDYYLELDELNQSHLIGVLDFMINKYKLTDINNV